MIHQLSMHKNIQMFSKKDYAASLLKGSIILYPQSGFGHELKRRNKRKFYNRKAFFFMTLQENKKTKYI
ncbi:hypothetical protein CUL16_13285 [Salmonella enterica subsp. enterica serovar Newport]|nr:hypothetical protein [Salmonella enterica subsp. enterica serovar Newport]